MLFEQMRKLMKRDRARHNVLQLSKFGLMQITRQRVRPAVEMDVREECPTCHGTGKIEPSLLFTDKLAQECQRYSDQFGRGLTLRLHPFICAFVEKGLLWNSLKWQWQRKYGVKVISSEMLGMLEYRFFDKNLQRLLIPEKAKLTTDQKAEAKAKIYATKPVQEKPEVVLKEEATEETKVQEQPKTEQPAEAPKKKSSRKKTKAETTPEQSKQEQPQQEQPKADQPAEASKKKRSRKKAKTETTPEQSKQEEPQQEQSKAEQPKEDQTETPKQGKPKSARKSRAAKAAKKETAPTDSANQA
jgi:hypothetical protein